MNRIDWKDLSLEKIKFFIEKKIDINTLSDYSRNFLHEICLNENLSFDAIKYLVENKIDINLKDPKNCNPLIYLISNKRMEHSMVEYLVEKNSDVNVVMDNWCKKPDKTLLHCATENENITLETVKHLIDLKINVNALTYDRDLALHNASLKQSIEIIKGKKN